MNDISQLYSADVLRAPQPRRSLRRILIGISLCAGIVFLLSLPWVPELQHSNPSTTAFMQLRESQARQHHQTLESHMDWRDLGQISPLLVHAVLLAEDDRFYQHHGFDFEQIVIALRRDWEKQRYVYGGSTLTQQLARTLYLSPKKTLIRKLREAAITLWMEACLRKRRILELYLNVVEWGPGIYGAEAAAQYYFHVPAEALTADQAIALAAILPSPRRWSPLSEKIFMAQRRSRLYVLMRENGYVPNEPSVPPPPAIIDLNQLQLPDFQK